MPRKTLKQKLRKQTRDLKATLAVQHEQAGITINFEQRKLQSIAMAHGLMAGLLSVKKHFEESGVLDLNGEIFKAIEKDAQVRIGVCVTTLLSMGLEMDQINKHIQQGL